MKNLKTEQEFLKVKEYLPTSLYTLNANYSEKNDKIVGVGAVEVMPMIFLHAEDMPEVVKNFYTSLGKAMALGTPRIAVACNNEKLEEILINKEGFKPLNFKVLVKEN